MAPMTKAGAATGTAFVAKYNLSEAEISRAAVVKPLRVM